MSNKNINGFIEPFDEEELNSNDLPKEIDDYIRSLHYPKVHSQEPSEPKLLDRQISFNGRNRCDVLTYRLGATPLELAAFAPNADVLWPGSLVKGESIEDGVLTPITLPRGRAWLTLGNIGNPIPGKPIESLSISVKEPSLHTVIDAAQELINSHADRGVAAQVGSEMYEYHNTAHAALQLNAAATWMHGNIRAGLSSDNDLRVSNFVVKFVQRYFDLSFNAPTRPRDIFNNGILGFGAVTVQDLDKALSPNPLVPAYVSTVSYGRVLLLTVSSKEESSSIKAYLNMAISGVTSQAGLDAKLMNSKFVQESEFKIVVIGGETEPALHVLQGPKALEKLTEFYKEGINFTSKTPAVPISYQLRWLSDFRQAQITFATDYKTQECSPQSVVRFGVRFQTGGDDKDGGDAVSAAIFRGNQVVWEANPIAPPQHKWDDGDPVPQPDDPYFGGVSGWFSGPPITAVRSDDCQSLRVRISKGGNKRWKFYVAASMWIEDGSRIDFLPLTTEERELGKGTPTQEFLASNC